MHMHRWLCLAILALTLLAQPGHAVEVAVTGTLSFDIDLAAGWVLHREPPDALVKELATHVAHEPAAAAATAEQIETVARRRLSANQAILYHAASGAHLDIAFSPLDPGEAVPGPRALRRSAEIAAGSLERESDVAEVAWEITPAAMTGADGLLLLSAGYLQHGRPMVFLGYVGYTAGYWIFLYFTAPGEPPELLREMRGMLARAAIRPASR